MEKIKTNSPELLWFFGLALALAAPAFITSTPTTPVAVQVLLLGLGSYAPAVAAMIVLARWGTPETRRGFWRRLSPRRSGWQWYALAAVLPTTIWLAAAALQTAWGAPRPPQWAGLAFLPVLLVVNLGEELGWRGYALPRLLEHFSPLKASLVLGLAWGAYHLPLYWQRPVFAVLIFGMTLAASVLLTWLFARSGGSVLVSTVFHAVFNAWSQVFLAPTGSEGMFATVVVLLAVLALFAGSRMDDRRPTTKDEPRRRGQDLRCAELMVRNRSMTAGQLAEATGLTSGAITGIVDRLEQAGWARRGADPHDRRRVVIHAGPQDTQTMAGLYDDHMRAMDRLLADYTDEHLALILAFVRRLTEINYAQAGKTRLGSDNPADGSATMP